ncbi:LapA family protein [Streptomyces sp. MZ04]|uniref:LapA family protein n=1 Tax=Streptomyces sp. MZ04 TaxID=2559236 RepID=UPI00107ED54A|nr:LapA family protein [Streptomyces sp. MZ04]TGB03381.1 LapA family protein [Streptomyces sp. MZ04]
MSPSTSTGGSKKSGSGGGIRDAMTPGRVAVAALVVLALVFIFENTGNTKIRLLIPEVTLPLWMALLGMGVIGALCGAYFMRRRK